MPAKLEERGALHTVDVTYVHSTDFKRQLNNYSIVPVAQFATMEVMTKRCFAKRNIIVFIFKLLIVFSLFFAYLSDLYLMFLSSACHTHTSHRLALEDSPANRKCHFLASLSITMHWFHFVNLMTSLLWNVKISDEQLSDEPIRDGSDCRSTRDWYLSITAIRLKCEDSAHQFSIRVIINHNNNAASTRRNAYNWRKTFAVKCRGNAISDSLVACALRYACVH